jgi:4-carboxymuconolactone decarboxylase
MGDYDDRMKRGFELIAKMGFPQERMLKQKEAYPAIYELTVGHLFGDIWSRPHLSLRERELITMAAIIAQGRPMGVGTHFGSAVKNGITKEQIMELIIHVGAYAGWPVMSHAIAQFNQAMEELAEERKKK